MAQCEQCGKRKSKRRCPALGLQLCPLCCGLLREKEVNCPPGCSFLKRHRPYQDERIRSNARRQNTRAPDKDIFRDSRLVWLAMHAEIPIFELARCQPDLTDRQVHLALKYARDKISKERALIILTEDRIGPRNTLGEAVARSLADCRFQRNVILPGEDLSYSREEKLKCLDRLIVSVSEINRGKMDGRLYLTEVARRFARIKDSSPPAKIISS